MNCDWCNQPIGSKDECNIFIATVQSTKTNKYMIQKKAYCNICDSQIKSFKTHISIQPILNKVKPSGKEV